MDVGVLALNLLTLAGVAAFWLLLAKWAKTIALAVVRRGRWSLVVLIVVAVPLVLLGLPILRALITG